MAVELVVPAYEELGFRQTLLGDKETMSYNHAYGGVIAFPAEKWREWYEHWIEKPEGKRYYRYIQDADSKKVVGETAYHYDEERDIYICDVIVLAKYRGCGYGSMALKMLCSAARKNGIQELWDDIAFDNPSVDLFLRNDFSVVCRTDESIMVKKSLF